MNEGKSIFSQLISFLPDRVRLRDMEPGAGSKPEQRIGLRHRHQNARIEHSSAKSPAKSKRCNGRPANNGALDFLAFLLFSETQFIELLQIEPHLRRCA
jgi:hypothetical protein